MLTGYRGIILALGLILTAAGPPSQENRGSQKTAAQTQNEQALQDIAASLREANKPSDLNEPCDKGAEKRDSDLCAQWKAADASASAADAAWLFGSLGILIGVMTLAAAGAAAWYAKKAAEHTAESVIEAKRSADAAEETMATTISAYDMQIRPYVAITIDDDENLREPFSRETILKFGVKNFGQIPATSVRLSMGEISIAEPIGDFVIPIGEKGGDYGLIAPGDHRQEKIFCQNLALSEIAELAQGQIKFMVRLRIDYIWPDGSDHHDVTIVLDDPKNNGWFLMHEKRRHSGQQ